MHRPGGTTARLFLIFKNYWANCLRYVRMHAWRRARARRPALMVRISRTFNNNRSLRVSGHYARGPRVRMLGRLVRAAAHTVLDDAHSRRIRTSLSL